MNFPKLLCIKVYFENKNNNARCKRSYRNFIKQGPIETSKIGDKTGV